MNNHANIFGASGMGKTWAVCWLAALMNGLVIMLDPQNKGAGEELAGVYQALGIPYQHEIVGGDKVLPMDFLPKSGGTEFEFWYQALVDSITAHRGQEDGYTMPLIQEHLLPFLKLMNETGKTALELDLAWFNGDVFLDQVKDSSLFAWLAQTPNPGSMAGRDRLPAKRFISVLKLHEIARRFLKEFTVPQLLNDGNNLIVSAGPYTTMETMSFYFNFLILAIVYAKIKGLIKEDITIIYEESELAGVSVMLAKMVQAVRKFGIGLWFVSQNAEWKSEGFNVTNAISNNCDTTIAFRVNNSVLRERVASLFPVYDPSMPKMIKSTPRSILSGFKEIDTTSTTTRGKSESVTEGIRHQNIYKFFQDINITFLSVQEQRELFKKAISKLKIGQALIKCGDQISIKQFQPLGKLLEKRSKSGPTSIHPQSPKYFREGFVKADSRRSDTSNDSTQGFDPTALL